MNCPSLAVVRTYIVSLIEHAVKFEWVTSKTEVLADLAIVVIGLLPFFQVFDVLQGLVLINLQTTMEELGAQCPDSGSTDGLKTDGTPCYQTELWGLILIVTACLSFILARKAGSVCSPTRLCCQLRRCDALVPHPSTLSSVPCAQSCVRCYLHAPHA